MTKLTDMERKVLAALFDSAAGNGHDFGIVEDVRGVVGKASLGGVVASLAKKGILWVEEPVRTDTGLWTQFTWPPEYDPRESDEAEARLLALIGHTPNAASKVSDKINMDGLAELFGLDTYEHLYERNIDYVMDSGDYAYKQAIAEGASEEEADEASMKGQEAANTELFHQWHDGVMAAAEELFGKHGLTLVPVKGKGSASYPYEYKVVPEGSWEKSLVPLIETINGVGYFHFNSVKEFLHSGPYTPRTGVLTHLHWIKRYPEVYGDTSAQRIYERHFR